MHQRSDMEDFYKERFDVDQTDVQLLRSPSLQMQQCRNRIAKVTLQQPSIEHPRWSQIEIEHPTSPNTDGL